MRVEPEEPEVGRDFELSIHSYFLVNVNGKWTPAYAAALLIIFRFNPCRWQPLPAIVHLGQHLVEGIAAVDFTALSQSTAQVVALSFVSLWFGDPLSLIMWMIQPLASWVCSAASVIAWHWVSWNHFQKDESCCMQCVWWRDSSRRRENKVQGKPFHTFCQTMSKFHLVSTGRWAHWPGTW